MQLVIHVARFALSFFSEIYIEILKSSICFHIIRYIKSRKKNIYIYIKKKHVEFPTQRCNSCTSVYNPLEIWIWICLKGTQSCVLWWIKFSDSMLVIYDEIMYGEKVGFCYWCAKKFKTYVHVGKQMEEDWERKPETLGNRNEGREEADGREREPGWCTLKQGGGKGK